MSTKKPLLIACVACVFAFALAMAGGCSPSQSSGGGDADAKDPSSYPVGSLEYQHVNGELDSTDDYSNKFCLGCHGRETINAANENYAGLEGVNPHKSHHAVDKCTTCHSVDGTSTLECNSCHDIPLPEGWQSAEPSGGPIHKLTE